jgi:PKD repeat protein
VRATDTGGLSAVAQATVNIINVAPTVGSVTVNPGPSTLGTAVIATATFSDPFPGDTPFTCTVNYGNGPQAGTVSGNTCTGPSHTYTTVGNYTVTVAVTDKDGGTGSASTTHGVRYNFAGFFAPVANPPVLNESNAGSSIPVKFSLGGNQGLNIFAAGYPLSRTIACDGSAPQNDIIETVNPGQSSLSYDAATGTYTYVWKTEKAWGGTCRELVVRFNDGTEQTARFRFK